ncbi:MAG: CPBP family intramembrane glutamic endopeptidase [Lachnospiraceae bacterium]
MENEKNGFESLQPIGVLLLIWSGVFIVNNFFLNSLIENLLEGEKIVRFVISSFVNQFLIIGIPAVGLIYKCKDKKIGQRVTGKVSFIFLSLLVMLWGAEHLFIDGCKWLFLGTSKQFVVIHGFVEATSVEILIYFLVTTVFAAFCEELLYRVAITKYLYDVPKSITIILSSVLFALAHVGNGWSNVFVALFLGLFLAYCYQKTKSYFLVVCMHYLFNALEIIFTYIICLPSDSSLVYQKVSSVREIVFYGLRYVAFSILLGSVFCMVLSLFLVKSSNGIRKNAVGTDNLEKSS